MIKNFGNDGMKILVFEEKKTSKQSLMNFPKQFRRYRTNNKSYFPLLPVLFLTFDINNKEKLAKFLYEHFGASPEGAIYHVRYWRKVNSYSRRIARLCIIKLYDRDNGNFKAEYIDMKNINRFGWFKG